MKGNISIGDFIFQVKKELMEAETKSDKPFYELKEVNLEVSFALEASGEGAVKLYVVEAGGHATASQTHKVILKLTPLKKSQSGSSSGGGSGGGFLRDKGVYYAPRKD